MFPLISDYSASASLSLDLNVPDNLRLLDTFIAEENGWENICFNKDNPDADATGFVNGQELVVPRYTTDLKDAYSLISGFQGAITIEREMEEQEFKCSLYITGETYQTSNGDDFDEFDGEWLSTSLSLAISMAYYQYLKGVKWGNMLGMHTPKS